MIEPDTPTEADLALVHALQLRPRATWVELAAAFEVTPATVARRWNRLADGGAAWITAAPGPRFSGSGCIAFVGVRCEPGHKDGVVDALTGDSQAVTVEITAGSTDLLLTVITPDLPSLRSYLLGRVDRIAGITSTTTMLATRIHTEGSRWRLQSLSPGQVNALHPADSTETFPVLARQRSELDRALLAALQEDGRISWADAARSTGTTEATARRRIQTLLRSGEVVLRCDVAAPQFGWPVVASLWGQAPPSELEHIARDLGRTPEIRLAATVTGTQNLLLSAWLHAIEDVQRLEAELESTLPSLTLLDRVVNLRTAKRMGRILDEHGQTVASVPITM